MKNNLLLLLLVVLGFKAHSQSKNSIYVLYGFAANSMYSHDLKADGGYIDGNSNMFGITYNRQLNRVFAVQTGLIYSVNQMQYNSYSSGVNVTYNAGFNLLTVPVLAKVTFLKYFFADGGLLVDFETSNNTSISNHQSGIGTQLGLGAQVSLNKINFFIAPVLQQHAIVNFDRSSYSLLNAGIRLGIGYNF